MFPQVPTTLRRLAGLAAASLAAAMLAGCSTSKFVSSDGTLLGWIKPYHVEVVQGNVVTKEQAAMIQPGMTREQVRDILGSPLLTDPFHADRWDYVFAIRRAGTEPQQRHIIVLFDGERLKSIEAPDLPSEQEFVNSIDVQRTPGRIPTLALTEEQIKALPTPKAAATSAAASAPEGPARSYPPLEPVAQ